MFQLVSRLYLLQTLLARFVTSLIPPFLSHNLGKFFALKKAFYLADLENLEGDYLEFGVFSGSSMSCALLASKHSRVGTVERRSFWGFDSFEGFGEVDKKDQHPFFTNLNFKTDFDAVKRRLEKLSDKNQNVQLVKGFFDATLDGKDPGTAYGIKSCAVALIDNDTYGGACSCFAFLEKILQPGSIILLDDFFSYKGSDRLGVKGAFEEWRKYSKFRLRRISDYGMGGVVYIVSGSNHPSGATYENNLLE